MLGRGGWAHWLRLIERVRVDDGSHPAPTLAADGVRGANLYRRNVIAGVRSAGARARVPVQVIVPSGDRWISPRYYEGLEALAPVLRRRTVEGSHWAPLVAPELVAGWIASFAADVEKGDVAAAQPWVRRGGLGQLRGRLALVTGAGSGIGRATALALGAHGARLLLVDRDGAAVEALAAGLDDAHPFTCDVADEREMQQLAERAIGEFGVPDVVVNNAGIVVSGPFLDTDFDDWQTILGVNLMGVVHGLPPVRPRHDPARPRRPDRQIASAAAYTPVKDLPAYSATKAAVLMLSECLRSELAPHGIGVNAICPGIVATNITRAAKYVGIGEQDQKSLRDRVTRLYARRGFTPDRVADEILRAIAHDIAVLPVTPEAKLLRASRGYRRGCSGGWSRSTRCRCRRSPRRRRETHGMLLKNRSPQIETAPQQRTKGFEHLDAKALSVLRWLLASRVEFVLVGDVAREVRGETGSGGPVAIVPAPYGRNLDRLVRALHSEHARLRLATDSKPEHEVKLTAEKLVRANRWELRCGEYEIDIEGRPRGVPRYQELLYEANRFELAPEVSVEVAAPEDIEHYEHVRRTGFAPEIRISRGASPRAELH